MQQDPDSEFLNSIAIEHPLRKTFSLESSTEDLLGLAKPIDFISGTLMESLINGNNTENKRRTRTNYPDENDVHKVDAVSNNHALKIEKGIIGQIDSVKTPDVIECYEDLSDVTQELEEINKCVEENQERLSLKFCLKNNGNAETCENQKETNGLQGDKEGLSESTEKAISSSNMGKEIMETLEELEDENDSVADQRYLNDRSKNETLENLSDLLKSSYRSELENKIVDCELDLEDLTIERNRNIRGELTEKCFHSSYVNHEASTGLDVTNKWNIVEPVSSRKRSSIVDKNLDDTLASKSFFSMDYALCETDINKNLFYDQRILKKPLLSQNNQSNVQFLLIGRLFQKTKLLATRSSSVQTDSNSVTLLQTGLIKETHVYVNNLPHESPENAHPMLNTDSGMCGEVNNKVVFQENVSTMRSCFQETEIIFDGEIMNFISPTVQSNFRELRPSSSLFQQETYCVNVKSEHKAKSVESSLSLIPQSNQTPVQNKRLYDMNEEDQKVRNVSMRYKGLREGNDKVHLKSDMTKINRKSKRTLFKNCEANIRDRTKAPSYSALPTYGEVRRKESVTYALSQEQSPVVPYLSNEGNIQQKVGCSFNKSSIYGDNKHPEASQQVTHYRYSELLKRHSDVMTHHSQLIQRHIPEQATSLKHYLEAMMYHSRETTRLCKLMISHPALMDAPSEVMTGYSNMNTETIERNQEFMKPITESSEIEENSQTQTLDVIPPSPPFCLNKLQEWIPNTNVDVAGNCEQNYVDHEVKQNSSQTADTSEFGISQKSSKERVTRNVTSSSLLKFTDDRNEIESSNTLKRKDLGEETNNFKNCKLKSKKYDMIRNVNDSMTFKGNDHKEMNAIGNTSSFKINTCYNISENFAKRPISTFAKIRRFPVCRELVGAVGVGNSRMQNNKSNLNSDDGQKCSFTTKVEEPRFGLGIVDGCHEGFSGEPTATIVDESSKIVQNCEGYNVEYENRGLVQNCGQGWNLEHGTGLCVHNCAQYHSDESVDVVAETSGSSDEHSEVIPPTPPGKINKMAKRQKRN